MTDQPPADLRVEPHATGATQPGGELFGSLRIGLMVFRLGTPGDCASLRLEQCNGEAGRLLHCDHREVVGRRIFEAFPGAESTAIPDLLCEVAEGQRDLSMDAVPYRDVRCERTFDLHVFPLMGRRCGVEFSDAQPRVGAERALERRGGELRVALESLWAEREVAQKLQLGMVPTDGRLDGYDVAARMRTAPIVGGDCVDAFEVDGAVWLLIGDVSGRDLPAALLAWMVQNSARSVVSALELQGPRPRPSVVLEAMNAAVGPGFQRIDGDQYMTLTALRVMDGRVMHAGLHQDLLVHRAATGTLDRFESEGLWLGVIREGPLNLTDQEFQLAEGDTLLLFTDGLIVPQERRGGQRDLEAAFLELAGAGLPVEDLVEALMNRRVVEPMRDDSTLLVARRRGPGHEH